MEPLAHNRVLPTLVGTGHVPAILNNLFSIENGKSRENSDLIYHLSINSEQNPNTIMDKLLV